MATATAIAAGKPMRLVLAARALALAQTASAQAVVPDPTITPGAVRTVDPAETCSAALAASGMAVANGQI